MSTKKMEREMHLMRHEAKYVIPRSMMPEIIKFIEPFCELDSHCRGIPPEYEIRTLQLDAPNMALHFAKENEAINRFKLRVRTYGDDMKAPVFLEIKQNVQGVTRKERASLAASKWGKRLFDATVQNIHFRTDREEVCFLNFSRLVKEIGARPVVIIRYIRTSYFGAFDHYARVTFDRDMSYLPTTSWTLWPEAPKWITMDSTNAQNKQFPFSGMVLELKSLCDAPQWMVELVKHFGLERTGHCKYSNAIWNESLFRGTPPAHFYPDQAVS